MGKVTLSDEFRKQFVVDIQGRDFILFDGLLSLAHEPGKNTPIQGIVTEVLQYPTISLQKDHKEDWQEINPVSGEVVNLRRRIQSIEDGEGYEMTAIVRATVTDSQGCIWTGIGDASPRSVTSKLVPAIIRMAETRAIGRALRMMLGIGTMLEELDSPYQGDNISKSQVQRLSRIVKEKSIDRAFLGELSYRYFGARTAYELTAEQADLLCTLLENDLLLAKLRGDTKDAEAG